jgi:hypothetical protein
LLFATRAFLFKKIGIVFSYFITGIIMSGLQQTITINTLLPMQKMISTANAGSVQLIGAGKPTMPVTRRQPVVERKISDPSSTSPKVKVIRSHLFLNTGSSLAIMIRCKFLFHPESCRSCSRGTFFIPVKNFLRWVE